MHAVFKQIELAMAQVLAGLDAEQTQLRSGTSPDKWSIQQIVEHLNLTCQSTQDTMRARLAKDRPTRARPSLWQHAMQFVVIRIGFLPSGRPAPPVVIPPPTDVALSGSQLLARVRRQLICADPIFTQAETAFGERRAITHHIVGPLSIPQWRKFHLVHARHHARQILAIRCDHGL